MSVVQSWLLSHSGSNRTAREIYVPIVASARQTIFYAAWGIPDTREGRFEMLALHVAVVMLRVGRAGEDGANLARAVAETFIADMDDNMREIGIGDLAVPRKIKKAGAALYDRHRDYGTALAGGDHTALAGAIGAAFSAAGALEGLDQARLTDYTERLWGALCITPDADCLAGQLPLPWPADPAASPLG
jgi:cytochrome b pre-mRNA-processing protein 3